MLASTVNPSAPELVTGTTAPVSGLVHTALNPSTGWRVKPLCRVSRAVTGAVVVPPGKVRLKLSAPVPEAVAPEDGAMVTPVAVVVAPNVQPPAGAAPVMEPAGAVFGTTCLTTVTEPLQLPSARFFRMVPTSA